MQVPIQHCFHVGKREDIQLFLEDFLFVVLLGMISYLQYHTVVPFMLPERSPQVDKN